MILAAPPRANTGSLATSVARTIAPHVRMVFMSGLPSLHAIHTRSRLSLRGWAGCPMRAGSQRQIKLIGIRIGSNRMPQRRNAAI